MRCFQWKMVKKWPCVTKMSKVLHTPHLSWKHREKKWRLSIENSVLNDLRTTLPTALECGPEIFLKVQVGGA